MTDLSFGHLCYVFGCLTPHRVCVWVPHTSQSMCLGASHLIEYVCVWVPRTSQSMCVCGYLAPHRVCVWVPRTSQSMCWVPRTSCVCVCGCLAPHRVCVWVPCTSQSMCLGASYLTEYVAHTHVHTTMRSCKKLSKYICMSYRCTYVHMYSTYILHTYYIQYVHTYESCFSHTINYSLKNVLSTE